MYGITYGGSDANAVEDIGGDGDGDGCRVLYVVRASACPGSRSSGTGSSPLAGHNDRLKQYPKIAIPMHKPARIQTATAIGTVKETCSKIGM